MAFYVTNQASIPRCTACGRFRPSSVLVWERDLLCGRCFRWAFQWKLSALDYGLLDGLHRRITDLIVTDGDLV
jgi:hypothetical protein